MTAITMLRIGVRLAKQGDWQLAEAAFCRAIQLNPNYAKAYNNLGLLLQKTNRLDKAEACLLRAVELAPASPNIYNNLGLVFIDSGRRDKAEACLRQAIDLNPNIPEFHNNLGLVLEDKNCPREAETAYRTAISLKPDYPDAHYNLGNLCKNTKRLDEAEREYLHALTVRPGFDTARFALSTLYLLQGQFEKGWESYHNLRVKKSRQLDIPRWQGEDVTGRRILLFHEQGLGDTIQFVRYAQMVSTLASDTVLWVQKPLQRLLANSYTALTVHSGEEIPAGPYDFACPLPALPMVCRSSENTIPQMTPYIHVPAGIFRNWEIALHNLCGNTYRIGVVWAGNPKHHNDRNRSIPYDVFRGLFAVGQVCWVSLQLGSRAEDLVKSDKVADLSQDLSDFAETAGVIANLDLIITVDSAVAHLAGAMGKETWVLLPFAPDWRWQLDRNDSPWYPSVRLFRQDEPGNWQKVVQKVTTALDAKVRPL